MHGNRDVRFYIAPYRLPESDLTTLGETELVNRTCMMIVRNNWEEFQKLVDHGLNMSVKGQNGRTCIMTASFRHRWDMLRRLLGEPEIDLNVRDKLGFTAVYLAASNSNLMAIRMLIEAANGRGSDLQIGVQDKKGQSAIHAAASKREPVYAEVLLDFDDSVIDQPDKNGNTPLMHACKTNSVAMVRVLIDRGADVNSANNKGVTALHISACKGLEGHVEVLLQHPDIVLDHRDSDDLTAMQQALWKGQTRVIQAFLDSPHAPSLLRHREADHSGRILTYVELARRRKNHKMLALLQKAVHKELFQILNAVQPTFTSHLLSIIAEFAL